MKVLISGGHFTPALAFLDYALQQNDVEIVFVGREFTQVKSQQPSVEKEEVLRRGVKFVPFHSGKMSRPNIVELLGQFGQLLGGVIHAFQIIRQEKPDVFVSFGSYIAVPLAFAAWVKRVPIVTHEQTRTAGVATKIIGALAHKVAISYPETGHHFPPHKVVNTGTPIRAQVFSLQSRPEWMPAELKKPLLYITGGSQGSLTINQVIAGLLPQLAGNWTIIHQCGRSSTYTNAKETLEKERQQLPPVQQKNYFIREWITEQELAWIYRQAQIIISRAGANTVQEIIRTGKPAIFIPLALAHGDEQRKNAEAVVETGAALMILQSDFTAERLSAALHQIQQNYLRMSARAKENAKQAVTDAEKRLFSVVKSVAKS